MLRSPLIVLALLSFVAPALATPIEGKVEIEIERTVDPDDATKTSSRTLLYVVTSKAKYLVEDEASETLLDRFRRKRVKLDATLGESNDGPTLTVTKVHYPVRWEGTMGTVGRTNPGSKWFSPTFTPDAGGPTLRVFGRSYFALKRITGRKAFVRGWHFPDTKEVCITDVRGKILEDTILTRLLVAIQGDVKTGEAVWVHGMSLFRLQVLVENRAGAVGHVLLEQVRIGEAEASVTTEQAKPGLTDALEQQTTR